MKILYLILCESQVEASQLNEIMKNKSDTTTFPGTWMIDTEKDRDGTIVMNRISSIINGLKLDDDFSSIVIGYGGFHDHYLVPLIDLDCYKLSIMYFSDIFNYKN